LLDRSQRRNQSAAHGSNKRRVYGTGYRARVRPLAAGGFSERFIYSSEKMNRSDSEGGHDVRPPIFRSLRDRLRRKFAQMPGVTAAFQEPKTPDLVLQTDRISVDESVNHLVELMKSRGCTL
jgi:hypothetical protein